MLPICSCYLRDILTCYRLSELLSNNIILDCRRNKLTLSWNSLTLSFIGEQIVLDPNRPRQIFYLFIILISKRHIFR